GAAGICPASVAAAGTGAGFGTEVAEVSNAGSAGVVPGGNGASRAAGSCSAGVAAAGADAGFGTEVAEVSDVGSAGVVPVEIVVVGVEVVDLVSPGPGVGGVVRFEHGQPEHRPGRTRQADPELRPGPQRLLQRGDLARVGVEPAVRRRQRG